MIMEGMCNRLKFTACVYLDFFLSMYTWPTATSRLGHAMEGGRLYIKNIYGYTGRVGRNNTVPGFQLKRPIREQHSIGVDVMDWAFTRRSALKESLDGRLTSPKLPNIWHKWEGPFPSYARRVWSGLADFVRSVIVRAVQLGADSVRPEEKTVILIMLLESFSGLHWFAWFSCVFHSVQYKN